MLRPLLLEAEPAPVVRNLAVCGDAGGWTLGIPWPWQAHKEWIVFERVDVATRDGDGICNGPLPPRNEHPIPAAGRGAHVPQVVSLVLRGARFFSTLFFF